MSALTLSAPEVAGAAYAGGARKSFPAFARSAVASSLVLLVVWAGARLVHAYLPSLVVALWAVGAFLVQLRPAARVAISVSVGAAALTCVNPVFSLYFFVLIAAGCAARKRSLLFVALIASGALLWPKLAFSRHYHEPGYWNWMNEPSLAMLLFVSAMMLRARANAARAGQLATFDARGPQSFLLGYLFPSHATNPMVFGPAVLERTGPVDFRGVANLLGAFVAKAAALAAIQALGPHVLLRSLTAPDAAGLSWAHLWGVVGLSYAETYLALAVGADIPVLVGRLYGWPLPAPFRAPFLAASPIELWRRWGIYNRRLLLDLVYYPLGGSRAHRYRNVVLTFLASALVLHSGWFGSKYWEVGPAGWRDETIYFMLQALAVCASLAYWDRRGGVPPRDAPVKWSAARAAAVLATQSYSALVHVVILAQGMDLAARWRLIGRCLGLGVASAAAIAQR